MRIDNDTRTRQDLINALEHDRTLAALDEDAPVWGAALRLIAGAVRVQLEELCGPEPDEGSLGLDRPAPVRLGPKLIAGGRRTPRSVQVARKPAGPPPSDEAVIAALRADPGQGATLLASVLGCHVPPLSRVLSRLVKSGAIHATGSHRAKRYYPATEPHPLVEHQQDQPAEVAP